MTGMFLAHDPENRLVAIARSSDLLSQLVKEYGEDRICYVVGDVSKKSTSEKAVALALEKFGRLDSIIANAGILGLVLQIENIDIDSWKTTFDVNLFAIVQLVQCALPFLKQSCIGRVLAVSSGAAAKGYSGWYAYGSSKAALNHFILLLASAETDISAISVAPGVVDTSMQTEIRNVHSKHMDSKTAKRFLDLHKNKLLVSPSEPATVLVNLVTQGWDQSVNGKFVRYDDQCMSAYRL